jgi:uncharacterized protein YndB with AHSA1/START domain
VGVFADRIERDILIQAPIERVWTILTEPAHLAAWFAFDGAEIELRPGGLMVLRWKEHGTFHARVEAVEPPSAFTFRWALDPDVQPVEGNSTLVAFSLSREGNGTRLRVVESGFAGLKGTGETPARHLDNNTEGWNGAFTGLQAYVAQLAA